MLQTRSPPPQAAVISSLTSTMLPQSIASTGTGRSLALQTFWWGSPSYVLELPSHVKFCSFGNQTFNDPWRRTGDGLNVGMRWNIYHTIACENAFCSHTLITSLSGNITEKGALRPPSAIAVIRPFAQPFAIFDLFFNIITSIQYEDFFRTRLFNRSMDIAFSVVARHCT